MLFKIILVFSLFMLMFGCKDDQFTIATNKDLSVKVYSERPISKAVIINKAFYLPTSHTDSLFLTKIDINGNKKNIKLLNELLPVGKTIDSVADFSTQLSSDNKILISFCPSLNSQNQRSWQVLKADTSGNISWNIMAPLPVDSLNNNYSFFKLFPNSLGGFTIISAFASNQPNNLFVFFAVSSYNDNGGLIKTKITKKILSQTSLKPSPGQLQMAGSVFKLLDDRYIIISSSNQQEKKQIYLKVINDEAKIVIDTSLITVNQVQEFQQLFPVNNKEFIIFVNSPSSNQQSSNLIIKANISGELQWEKTIESNSQLSIYSVNKISKGFLLLGSENQTSRFVDNWCNFTDVKDAKMIWIMFDDLGNTMQPVESIQTQNPSVAGNVIEHQNGELIILGGIYSFSLYKNLILVKTDSKGNILSHGLSGK